MNEINDKLAQALWKIYRRPPRPVPWESGGNLPWNDPEFSQRMLREHLDQSHDAASRSDPVRALQLDWLWEKLDLRSGARVLDVTCGPGLYSVALAQRGCEVLGVDFGPASVAYARNLAKRQGVSERCTFVEQDVRQMDCGAAEFDAALFIYGQITVFTPQETQTLLDKIYRSLRPGGRLCVEILDQEKIDKTNSQQWFTADQGLWGDAPFLFLAEQMWYPEEQLALNRFHILHLDSGDLTEVQLADQSYSADQMCGMMEAAGFTAVQVYPAWDGLEFNDVERWVLFVSEKQ